MSPILAALLGGKIQAPEEQQEDIVVESSPFPKPRVQQGLIGGPLRLGSTGGNLIGLLGDAFAAGAGRKGAYAPRVEQAREAEALQDYTTDPLRATQQYGTINGPGAAKLWEDHLGNEGEAEARQSLLRQRAEALRAGVQKRGYSLLRAATAETYGPIRDQVSKYFAAKGIEPDFDLPATFADAARSQPWNSEITPEQQERLESQEEYRQMLDARARMQEGGRNTRAQQSNAVREAIAARTDATRNRTANQTDATRNRTANQTDKTRRDTAKFSPDPTKIYVQNGHKFRYDPTTKKYVSAE